jgi:hypothetical protein
MMVTFDLPQAVKSERLGRRPSISPFLAFFDYLLRVGERDWQPSETKTAKYGMGAALAFLVWIAKGRQ